MIREWLFKALGAVVVNGYGTTETGGLSSNSFISPGVHLQLIDCPELNYFTSDEPHPRGEILAFTNKVSPGYYNDKQKTEESFVNINGKQFFRTGDIGQLIDGKIEVIDRKKSMIKLSQGCFVAPEYLETIFTESSLISQIFIYGDSLSNCVSSVIVPSQLALNNIDNTLHPDENDSKIISKIRKDLRNLGKLYELQPWEIPQVIIIEKKKFTVWNGLLTTIGKINRPKLIQQYKDQFISIWNNNSINTQHVDQNKEISNNTSNFIANYTPKEGDLCIGVVKLISDILQISPQSFTKDDSIMQLGADSLTLARLSNQIKKKFGSDIPLPALVKFESLEQLQTAIFNGMSSVTSIMENSLSMEFLTNEVSNIWEKLQNQLQSITQIDKNGNDILLTGANGFLGCFILQSLLSKSSSTCKIYCIIRGKNNQNAKQRLLDSLDFYKIDFDEEYFNSRVEILSGDISKPFFGLDNHVYNDLCEKVDIVYHNAAMVNSILSYEQHKPTNVLGVFEIIKFILSTNEPKFLNHISTVGMLGGTLEEYFCVPISPYHEKLGGYGQSKWVGEQLINLLKKNYTKVKINIFRPSTIFGSTKTGASNPKDTAINMIRGLITEGVYFQFFDTDNSMLPGNFNLVPVDWAADSIVELSFAPYNNSQYAFHISGLHTTSLETIIQYIQECKIVLKKLTVEEFKNVIQSIQDEKHPLYFLKSVIVNSGYATNIMLPTCDKTCTALNNLGLPTAPTISFPIFAGVIDFLQNKKEEYIF